MGGAESGIWQEGTAGDGQAFEKLQEKSLVAGNTCRLTTINSQGGKGEKKMHYNLLVAREGGSQGILDEGEGKEMWQKTMVLVRENGREFSTSKRRNGDSGFVWKKGRK